MESIKKYNFIEKAKAIHKNRYDYSKVHYINAKTKIIITCKQHGDFEQSPTNHLSGFNCQKCAKNLKINTTTFIEKANMTHNNKFDYSKVNYVNADTKITIICKEHGEFEQIPDFHLNRKCGCPKCANNITLTNDEFIERATIIHIKKYDYARINYVNNRTNISIICKEHGEFCQTPTRHLAGDGCPSCINKTEYKFYIKLLEKYPSIQRQFKADWCKQKLCLPFDFVIEEKKKIIEMDGPQHFVQVANWRSPVVQHEQDLFKMKCANENGYSVIRVLQKEVADEILDYEYLVNCIETSKLHNEFICNNCEYSTFCV
jgi:very-short-patch-repair endonuclease